MKPRSILVGCVLLMLTSISHAKHFSDYSEMISAVYANPASIEEASFEFERIEISEIEIASQRNTQRIAVVTLRTSLFPNKNYIHCYLPVKDAADLKKFSYVKEESPEYKVRGKVVEVVTSKEYNQAWNNYHNRQDIHASCIIEPAAPATKVEKTP